MGDDDAWESLCRLISRLTGCAREYWSGNPDERRAMAGYGFDVYAGWLIDLLAALNAGTATPFRDSCDMSLPERGKSPL